MGASYSTLFVDFRRKQQVLLYWLSYLDYYMKSYRFILSFNPFMFKKIYILLMNLKFQILKLLLNKYILNFNRTSYYQTSQWIVNHSVQFESNNVLSICSKEEVTRFGKSCAIDDIIVYKPRPSGEIFFKNRKLYYILEEDNVTILSYDKATLNDAVEDMVKGIINITQPINSVIKTTWYKPKVFLLVKTIEEEKPVYTWIETSEVNEKVLLFFDDETNENVIKPFDDFYASRDLYHELGIAYKLVSVFSGKPGMGKTVTVKYLAQKYSRDIYMFSTLDIPNDTFLRKIKDVPCNSIILFDDFDKMPINHSLSVTILGLLDGAITMDGTCLIFVLNDYNVLERTFRTITRPGRINLNLDFNTFDTSNTVVISIRELFIEPDEKDIKKYLSTYPVPPKISEVKNDCLTSSRNIKTCIKMRKKNKLVKA